MNLALYDCDVLVVTGTSYFLWVMDNLKEISAEVARIWEEDHKNMPSGAWNLWEEMHPLIQSKLISYP